MLSNKPYLIRAFYEWIIDSKCTPLLVINTTFPRCNVPQDYIENNEITLNISPSAIRDLKVSSNLIEFKASFSGIAHLISAPIKAVMAVYAEENGQGMYFDPEENTEDETDWGSDTTTTATANRAETTSQVSSSKDKKKSHLTLIE